MAELPEVTHPKKLAFLAAYAIRGTIVSAAKDANIVPKTHYNWLRQEPEAEAYKLAFEAAKAQLGPMLEDEAVRRAMDGVDEPIYQQGVKVGTKRRYSDVLLIFLLKGIYPDKYRERMGIQQENLAALYGDPLEQRNGHGGRRQQVAAGLAQGGNGRSA